MWFLLPKVGSALANVWNGHEFMARVPSVKASHSNLPDLKWSLGVEKGANLPQAREIFLMRGPSPLSRVRYRFVHPARNRNGTASDAHCISRDGTTVVGERRLRG